MDKGSMAQPELFAEMMKLAEGSGIAHQVKMAVAGGNDSGPAQRAGCRREGLRPQRALPLYPFAVHRAVSGGRGGAIPAGESLSDSLKTGRSGEKKMFELLKTLADAYGATGRETKVANVIEGLVREHVDSVRRDNLGNLICVKNGTDPNGKRIMLSAHMDHIGFIVAAVEKEGFLRWLPWAASPDVSQTRHVRF